MFALRWRLVGLLLLLLLPAQVGAAAPPGANGPPATSGIAPAVVPIGVGNGWIFFNWGGPGEPFDNQGPFTITTVGPAALRVTDAFCSGDRFRLYDGDSPIGDTSLPGAPDCNPEISDPDTAFRLARFSSGCFALPPGAHSIRAQVIVNPFPAGGAAYLRVDGGTCANASPQVYVTPYFMTTQEGLTAFVYGFANDFEHDLVSLLWTAQPGPGTDPGASCAVDYPTNSYTSFRCTDDGAFTLTLSADDGHGGTGSAGIAVTVTNLPPTIGGLAPLPGVGVPSSASVLLSARLSDLGANDTATCRIAWGDGATTAGVVVGGLCTSEHRYPAAGRYVARLLAADDDGGQASTTIPFNVGGSACAAGRVTSAVVGIDPVGDPASAFAPTDLARVGTTGLFPGTRYNLPRAGAAASTYVARGETVITGLYVANIDGAAHPGIALSVKYPPLALGLGSRVVAADGSSAYIQVLGSQPLPRYLSNYLTAYDRNGELLIVSPPRDAAGNIMPLFIATTVRPSAAGSLIVEAGITGEVVNGQLRGGLANVAGSLCGDKMTLSVAPFVGGPIGGALPIGDLPYYP